MLSLFAMLTVWVRLSTINLSYQLNQSKKILDNLKKDQEKLQYEISQLKAPKRLKSLAKKKYKLHPPKMNQVIYLESHLP